MRSFSLQAATAETLSYPIWLTEMLTLLLFTPHPVSFCLTSMMSSFSFAAADGVLLRIAELGLANGLANGVGDATTSEVLVGAGVSGCLGTEPLGKRYASR